MEPVTIMVAAMTIRSLLGIMVTNLNKVAVYHVMRAWKLSKVLEDLKQSIEIIDAVLEDADNPQSKTKAMEVWLGHLSGLANDANALFDKIITMESEQEMKNKISRVFCKLSYGFKMGKELEKLKGRFDLAIKNRSLTLIPETSKKESSSRMTSCNVIESSIHGRADEKKRIVDELIHGLCATSQLSIYAICGMGGIGKTALAQLVYNDTSVIHHFQRQMWVCVSDNFDVFRLTREILECAGGATPSGSTQRNLNEQSVKSMLQGIRFLLVLDDVWNDDSDKWDELMKLLSFGATGSTVMVTTRAETVVTAIRSPSPGSLFQKVVQKVQGLSEGDPWNMFKWYAFEDQHHIEHESDIMVMGKEMAKKCSGVPLAIKTLGSLMRRKQNVKEWECVLENMHWQDDILPILRLSYSHLPRRLRSCFAYCCIFPKDHVYQKDQMVLLWIANGFVTPQDGKELLDVGNEYFWELADRSLFQDVTESYSAAMYKSRDHAFSWCDDTTFSIHDLMHDLALSSMADTYLTVGTDTKRRIPDKVSHLHLLENFSLENIKKGSLQSLLVSPKFNTQVDSLSSCMLKEKNLTTLDIGGHRSYKRFSVYPVLLSLVLPSINKLRQLRYLDLSFQQDIETLPKSVGSLINLETLKLFGCHNLIELPNNMNHMINLIYLDVRFCDALTHFPPGIGALSNLHILSDKYIADDGTGQDVSILGISNFVGVTEVDSGNKMRNLYSLRLSWQKDFHFGEDGDVCLKRNIMEKIFDGLRPRRDLSNLVIKGYEGRTFPSWIAHSYHTFSLTSNRLDGIVNCKCLPPLWKLPCLRILSVSGTGHQVVWMEFTFPMSVNCTSLIALNLGINHIAPGSNRGM
ncbi:hypothetical protein QQ045_004811 [Rhodiola kirilowii]